MSRYGTGGPLGVGFIGLGFLIIFIAWNGAAGQDCAECQIPYLLSGGAVGIGLIIMGCALLLYESQKRDRAHQDDKLDRLIDAVRSAGASSSNGRGEVRAQAAPVVARPGEVVVGKSSYHEPDCRLVEGKEGLVFADKQEAISAGLKPCRVCEAVTQQVKPVAKAGTKTGSKSKSRRRKAG